MIRSATNWTVPRDDSPVPARRVADALDLLEPNDREVIIRVLFQRTTCRDLAAELGVGEDSIKARIRRALHRIGEALGDDRGPDTDRPAQLTTTVAVIEGCRPQMYAYEPAVANVNS